MFVDHAKIEVRSGAGGSGCVSFLREKYIPKGGPDGGDGGKGGSVIFVANDRMHSLLDFQRRRHFRADRGVHGKGANKHGKSGKDIVIKVPVGTAIYDDETGELIGDLVKPRQRLVAAKGGRGGRGNARFVSSTHQAPRDWEPGGPAVVRQIRLELKLIADVGLVGLPNAGKSTLLSRISRARPKIAGYPFTTLKPNLGVVAYRTAGTFIVADIPGLIEGAHAGKGLGHDFLKHIERTRVLLVLVDGFSEEAETELETLMQELESYDADLLEKPRLLVLNKADLLPQKTQEQLLKKAAFRDARLISAVTGDGLEPLIDELWRILESLRQA